MLKSSKVVINFLVLVWLSFTAPAVGGSYLESAHGNGGFGANRQPIDARYAQYATGNCAHCHEAHASLDGLEPEPRTGAAPHTLFYPTFNTARTQNLYTETDNFCFYCHGDAGQRVINQDYSAAFGGAVAGSGPQSILAAFNQESYHNLYDIWNFAGLNTAYPWFTAKSNPCSACHNPHLARRNWDPAQPGFPLLSAVSRPIAPARLWGEAERMSAYPYEAPYAFSLNREPAGVGLPDGDNTPDYVGFCTECHNPANLIWSTPLNRNLRKVNWGTTGETPDKHGARPRQGHPYSYGTPPLLEPYREAAAVKTNFVLSCLDCHEPHGSTNIMLLRRRVNGGDLPEPVSAAAAKPLLPLCVRCHDRGHLNQLHHEPGYLAPSGECTLCHPNGGDQPEVVACRQCHYHGKNL
ncbi:MAG: hypothetical protein IH614_14425 [Desulfuromonadales bacterium]|nr:hypothetical protein [Desulfuromonadales bacterium]